MLVGVKVGVDGSCDVSGVTVTSAEFSTPVGGGAGIRTQGDPKASAVFKTAAFDRSATPPER
jgi:hypothetical protein